MYACAPPLLLAEEEGSSWSCIADVDRKHCSVSQRASQLLLPSVCGGCGPDRCWHWYQALVWGGCVM
jgi:hypothetical protein